MEWKPVMMTNSSSMRAFSARSDDLYRSPMALVSSYRVAMRSRLIVAPTRRFWWGAKYVRQRLNFQEHCQLGNATSHPNCRAMYKARFARTRTERSPLQRRSPAGLNEGAQRLAVPNPDVCSYRVVHQFAR